MPERRATFVVVMSSAVLARSTRSVSTTQAEGLEDRMTMAPLGARRLEDMVELGARVASIELLLAAQACDLRGARLGSGTDAVRARVREFAPFLEEGDILPDLELLVDEIRSGSLLD